MSGVVSEKTGQPTIAGGHDAASSTSSHTRGAQNDLNGLPAARDLEKKDSAQDDSIRATGTQDVEDPVESKLPAADQHGRVEFTEEAGWDYTAYNWSPFKKWWVLTVIFAVQVSMNFNTSVWPNAIETVEEKFGVSGQAARTTQMIFLVAYAFGSELWAPFSEEFGRKPILQMSLFLVNSECLPRCHDKVFHSPFATPAC